MTKRILCLHTAGVHEGTFGQLFAAVAPGVTVDHVVRPEWLATARARGLDDDLTAEVAGFMLARAETYDAVLCSCSTLGPLATMAARERGNIVRIDAPLMRAAAATDGVVLVAFCLESTRAPTIELLEAAFAAAGKAARHDAVLCAEAWPHFERGETLAFAKSITARVTAATERLRRDGVQVGCVVLAQASMAAAEPLLAGLGVPVLCSPPLAVAATLAAATSRGVSGT